LTLTGYGIGKNLEAFILDASYYVYLKAKYIPSLSLNYN